MEETYGKLVEKLGEVQDLAFAAGLLAWDQRTMMPPGGAHASADQLATLARLVFERFTSDEIGELLEQLEPYGASLDYDSDEASLLRVTRRDYGKARRVPLELRAEKARAAALAEPVWREARETSDFDLFLPHLEHALELMRQYIACFEPADEPYDVLLDDYEPEMKTAEVRAIFDELRDGLVVLLREIAERQGVVDGSPLEGMFPIDKQKEIEATILDAFGFTDDEWRLDETAHPFASKAGPQDMRLTTRHSESNLTSIFASMHEFGHGLYEYQIDRALYRTPLLRGASLGVHESQSRLWENMVGRSLPFWRRFYPDLQSAFPGQLDGVDVDGFYRAVNLVRPSLIRIHADEVTYNLHIIIRFELEQELADGSLAAADVPEAWDARVKQYLGIDVPDIADGCLQDVHWSGGAIGYFPTYALGNVIAGQLWDRLRQDLPDLEPAIERGELGALREWLGENIHRHGRKFMPRDLVQRVVGGPIDPKPLLAYLRAKYGAIYGL
jgi:carboxypeptidase Taq